MTKEDAAIKIMQNDPSHTRMGAFQLVFALEALGLIKFDKIELVSANRPVEWGHLKRDFDRIANDILACHNPDAMREAIKHFKYVVEELG